MQHSAGKYAVSVIIPTYNRSHLLRVSLDSLCLQDIDRSLFEVVVADDGSTDDTEELVRSYGDKINIKYVFQEDLGFRAASARNLGILASTGEICVFIDSGVVLHSGCLRQHLVYYREGDNAAAIGYVYGFVNGEKAMELYGLVDAGDPDGSIERVSQNPEYQDLRNTHYQKYRDNLKDLPAPWYYFWTCHASVPRSRLLSVGLFDERYDGRWGAEDNDLGYRLHLAGVKIDLLRAAKSLHYPHPKDEDQRQKDGYENAVIFHDKFRTTASKLLLETCTNPFLTDINELLYVAI